MGVHRKEKLILYNNFLDSLINGSTQERREYFNKSIFLHHINP